MKSIKDLFRGVVTLNEGVKEDIKAIVKGDVKYETLRKAALTNDGKEMEFIDYVVKTYSEAIDAVIKKNKITYDDISDILLKK